MRCLLAEGVDVLYGYPGGAIMPVYDELYKYEDKINHVLTRHEQCAAHAAQGYARISGKVGVAIATSGPGATNLVTGIADAQIDSTPIVCITGQVPSHLLGSDAFQETDIVGISTPVTKWNHQVTKASQIPEIIARAFYIAKSGRPGPVLIDITKDAQFEEFDFQYKKCIGVRSYVPPFFLQVSHYAVHSDIMMRKETLEKYKDMEKGMYQKHLGFAAMTEDLDTGVGLLLDRVKELGLEINTYIICTSDNGAVPIMPPKSFYKNSSNFPLSRGKWDALEGGIRVPFIITGPDIMPGAESKTPITFSDLLPTITDIAGYKLPLQDDLDGGSLKNILTKDGIGKVTRISEGLIFHVPYENGIAIKRAHSAIIVDNFKLIKFYNNNELLLFDIKNDIKEKNNLAASLPEKVTQLEVLLDNYLSKVKAPKWQPGISWKNKTLEKFNSYH